MLRTNATDGALSGASPQACVVVLENEEAADRANTNEMNVGGTGLCMYVVCPCLFRVSRYSIRHVMLFEFYDDCI